MTIDHMYMCKYLYSLHYAQEIFFISNLIFYFLTVWCIFFVSFYIQIWTMKLISSLFVFGMFLQGIVFLSINQN